MEIIIAIFALLISTITFIHQHKQNYTQNVFQMINTFQRMYDNLHLSVTPSTKIGLITKVGTILNFHSNETLIFLLKCLQNPFDEINQTYTNEMNYEKAIKYCKDTFAHKIDSLIIQVLFIEKYMNSGFFIKPLRWLFDSYSFNSRFNDLDFVPDRFIGEYQTLKGYFKSTIYKEFKLIVLFFYINDKKDIYKEFLSINKFGALENEDFSYYFRDDDYHKYLLEKVNIAIKELNTNN
jgi:hypothetical protein